MTSSVVAPPLVPPRLRTRGFGKYPSIQLEYTKELLTVAPRQTISIELTAESAAIASLNDNNFSANPKDLLTVSLNKADNRADIALTGVNSGPAVLSGPFGFECTVSVGPHL